MPDTLEGSRVVKPFERISDHHVVTAWFGCWPSFHDGEVHSIRLERNVSSAPSLEIDLRAWLLVTSESGELVQSKEALVSFRFDGISELSLEGFNHQNVITALHVAETESAGQLDIEFEHCYQFACSFKAESGKVVQLTPCQKS